jgi:hypothetical protein
MTATLRSTLLSGLAALALALGLALTAVAPAQAQELPDLPELPPLQDGLINVNVSDVVVQLPIAVAANVCDLNVNVLSRQVDRGQTDCDAVAESGATVPWNDGNRDGNGQQRGLVNVNVSDIVVQIPIAAAVNICDVDVNVLARQRDRDTTVCDAQAYAPAEIA